MCSRESLLRCALVLLFMPVLLPAQESFWEPVFGPGGGQVNVVFSDPELGVVAGTNNGVFISTDEGQLWRRAGLHWNSILSVASDGAGRLFAGTDGDGLMVSDDSGANWRRILRGGTNVFAIVVKGDLILVGTSGGIFRSSNGGEDWTQVTSFTADIRALIAVDANTLLAGEFGDGVFRSTDGGLTWLAVNAGLVNRHINALAVDDAGRVFAATGGGIFVSEDLDGAWQPFSSQPRNLNVTAVLAAENIGIFAGTTTGVFQAVNDGQSWRLLNSTLTGVNVAGLGATPGGGLFIATQLDGMFFSGDGGSTWHPRNRGLTIDPIDDLAFHDGVLYAASFGGGVFRSRDHGTTWQSANQGLTDRLVTSVAAALDGTVYIGTFSGVFRLLPGEEAWEMTPLTRVLVDFVFADSRGSVFALARGGPDVLYRSTDVGATWRRIGGGLDATAMIVMAETQDGDLLLGGDGLFISTDGGTTWSKTALQTDLVFALAVDQDGTIFVATRAGVFASDDRGETWAPLSDGLPDEILSDLLATPTGEVFASMSSLFVEQNRGVFRLDPGRSTWVPVNSGLIDKAVNTLLFEPETGYLFTGTDGWGVFRSLERITNVERISRRVPESFSLAQNYPNPFNPTTTIEFAIAQRARVSLQLYDQLGRKVRTLVDGTLEPGTHRARLDARDLPSGVYFYRLQAGAFKQTRKLTLIR